MGGSTAVAEKRCVFQPGVHVGGECPLDRTGTHPVRVSIEDFPRRFVSAKLDKPVI
jgi:hypothetical protein